MRTRVQDKQSGAALITALVITAVMSITVLAVLDMMRFSYRVAVNTANRDQARLYLIGAERLAAATIKAARTSRTSDSYPELDAWTKEPLLFPIDGGRISGRVIDGSNCFNVNSVVSAEENGLSKNVENTARLTALLEFLDIVPSQASELSSALVDWIDTNPLPENGGAEDAQYMSLEIPYRTSGTLLADITELRAIAGFTPEIVHRLTPFVCAYPTTERQPLNINSIGLELAPLLLAYLGDGLSIEDVNEILAERPVSGFKSIDDFLHLSVFGDDGFPEGQSEFVALKSQYYSLHADVIHHETAISLETTLMVTDSGAPKTISRKYGAG